ncbi:formylglycine-generating enzyme family protein [Vannielia litorea]|uniref:Formylglycine-generating enzyme, required for sulfatase activity, contains SUMF1/FGE domain n=1 Tax=Vannielia litorea TaxID=1217970 RepID=A0A1N6IDS2_9RHOB|nr:SUMF1/EgtB/PvdO family nonheme iron enzyme [Vannielia litorea]SIO30152.1 Formylglycine-generating enzyme, required for sulfatase activity, contains SUMF1/FGE domain [Vannielia litorea]
MRKSFILAGCALATGVAVLAALAMRPQTQSGVALPETVMVAPGQIAFRPLGNFSREGKASTPGALPVEVAGFEIMKYQVSRAEYLACVADGACEDVGTGEGGYAQTMVNWADATAYAAWFSRQTGETWRLPSEPEWQRAAAERQGDAAPDEGELDPGTRMLSQYERGVLLRGSSSPALRPLGGFGENSLGLADLGGNVWEWTDGCMATGRLAADGSIEASEPYCGVRIAGGRHRAAVIDFVRDASVGGCAVGLPPDHLGFRLVREG